MAEKTDIQKPVEDESFEEYKENQLRKLGLSVKHARELSEQAEITIRKVESLIVKGCPPHLAYKILKPI